MTVILRGAAVTVAVGLGLVASVWIGEPAGQVLYLVYAGIGGYLAIRRPANRLGWLLILVAWGIGLGSAGADTVKAGFDPTGNARLQLVAWASSAAWTLIFLGMLAIMLTYPDGRLPAGRGGRLARLALGLQVVVGLLIMTGPTITLTTNAVTVLPNPLAILPEHMLWQVLPPTDGLYPVMLAILLVALVGMLRRWRRADGLARQQYRWLVAAFGLVCVATAGWAFISFVLGQPPNGPAYVAGMGSLAAVPAAIAIAVLRYRLYEIDRIISRTVSWAVVSGILVVTFAALVVGLQAALDGLTQRETLAVAASTLIAFALFQPVRQRVQRAVDRRFDRARYDAERTAAAFAERLRDEIDLETLTAELRATAAAAVRPRDATVWLPSRGGR
jgi:hypothetical protein